jgi:hypothetical protein
LYNSLWWMVVDHCSKRAWRGWFPEIKVRWMGWNIRVDE